MKMIPSRMFEIVSAGGAAARELPDDDRQREDDRDVAEVLAAVRAHGPIDDSRAGTRLDGARRSRDDAARRPARRRSPASAATRGASAASALDRLGREAVADPEVRVDVAPARRGALELLAQLAHEDVDRAVAVDHRVAPHALVDLLALQHLALGLGEQLDELELAAGELDATTPPTNAWNWSARISSSPISDRRRRRRARRRACGGGRRPRRGRSAPPGGRAWSPSRRRPAAARARAGRREDWPVQTTTPSCGQPGAELLEVGPALRARAPRGRPPPR